MSVVLGGMETARESESSFRLSAATGDVKTTDNEPRTIDNSAMPKWAKFIAAVLLVPVCLGAALALWRVLRSCGGVETTWVPLLAGAASWVVIYLLLPKPMWVYVFGHELTHALWTWAFGGTVKKFKATAGGGYVVVSKNNFLIMLAPYFFPVYVALTVLVFAAGHWVWDWGRHLVWFHWLVGAAYAFHVTLTWHVLQTRQSDITQQGRLFSAVVIFLGNVLVLLLGIPLLTAKVHVLNSLGWWLEYTGEVLHQLGRWL